MINLVKDSDLFLQLANAKGFYSLAQCEAKGIEVSTYRKSNNNYESIYTGSDYLIQQFFKLHNEYIEYSETFIFEVETHTIAKVCKKSYNEKKFSLSSFNIIPTLHYSLYEKQINAIDKPNFMGVVNSKKLAQWFDYIRTYESVYKECEVNFNNARHGAQQSMEELVKRFKAIGAKVQEFQGATYIYHNDFEFRLSVEKDYLNKMVKYNGNFDKAMNLLNV